MALQCTSLLLISVFFSKALALNCYGCIPDTATGECTDAETECQSLCMSMTMTVSEGGFKQYQSLKACADSFGCPTGSINYGESKMTINSECCNRDLCNTQKAPELPRQPPNGKSCFSCDKTNCLKVLPCESDETQCFTTSVKENGKNQTLKGCSSKLFCGSDGSRVMGRSTGSEIKCCEGNLCNSAHSIRVFLSLMALLIFLLFF